MKILVLLILFISINSYGQRIYNDSLSYAKYKQYLSKRSKKRYRFGKEKFKNRIIENMSKSKIDFESVYYTNEYNEYEKRNEFTFFRYFKSGEVFTSAPYYLMPDTIELNQLDYGSYNYYSINKDGVVIEEVAVKDFVPWIYDYIIFSDSSATLFKYKLGRDFTRSFRKITFIYKRKKVKFTNYNIVWK